MRSRNNDEKSVIEKITDAVKANLAQNSEHSKTIENPQIDCVYAKNYEMFNKLY